MIFNMLCTPPLKRRATMPELPLLDLDKAVKNAHVKLSARSSYSGEMPPRKSRWKDVLRSPSKSKWTPFKSQTQQQRSSSIFKLKAKVRVCEMWMGSCLDEVSEVTRSPERSFVMGWPTTNVVATFTTPELKQQWETTLKEYILEEKKREEPKTLVVKILNKEMEECTMSKSLTLTNTEEAQDIVKRCMEEFHMEGEAKDYQLWIVSGKDDSAPYPLIGHEHPYSIKMNHVRDAARKHGDQTLHPMDLDGTINGQDNCQIVMRAAKKPGHKLRSEDGRNKKHKKSPRFPFFKNKRGSEHEPQGPTGKLFGHSLTSLYKDNRLPKPIWELLHQLFIHGPYTKGIFRKSGNLRQVRECQEKLDNEEEYDFSTLPIQTCSALLKEFLRRLPDSLMTSQLYQKWTSLADMPDEAEKLPLSRELLKQMPVANADLLSHIMCVLYHIQLREAENSMDATNLGVCFGPTVFRDERREALEAHIQTEVAKEGATLKYLIQNCIEIFGPECMQLFGEPIIPKPRQDSSTDSDSVHSSLPEQTGALRRCRDDSSIDSLDIREYCHSEMESSPRLLEGRLSSTTMLSTDSGLPMSEESDMSCLQANGFQRSISQIEESKNRTADPGQLSRSYESQLDAMDQTPPIPPPRRKGRKPEIINTRRGPFPASGQSAAAMRQAMLRHAKRMSSESLGSLDEFGEMSEDDFHYVSTDMGVLRKSESGARLYIDDELIHGNAPPVPSSPAAEEADYPDPEPVPFTRDFRNIKRRKEHPAANPSHRHTWSEYTQDVPDLSSSYAGAKPSVQDDIDLSSSYGGGPVSLSELQYHMSLSPPTSPDVESRGMSQPQSAPTVPRIPHVPHTQSMDISETPTHRPHHQLSRPNRPQQLPIHPAAVEVAYSQNTAKLPAHQADTSGTSSPRTDDDDCNLMRKRRVGMTAAGGDIFPKHQMRSMFTRPIVSSSEAPELPPRNPTTIEKSASDSRVTEQFRQSLPSRVPAHQPPAYHEAASQNRRPNKPPSYQEAMERKSMLQAEQLSHEEEQQRIKQRQLSEKARKIYEDSVRRQLEEDSRRAEQQRSPHESRLRVVEPKVVEVKSQMVRSASEERHHSPARQNGSDSWHMADTHRPRSNSAHDSHHRKRITRHNAYRAYPTSKDAPMCERTSAPNVSQLQRSLQDNKENKVMRSQEALPVKASPPCNSNILQRSQTFDMDNMCHSSSEELYIHSCNTTDDVKLETAKQRLDRNTVISNKYEAESKSVDNIDKGKLSPHNTEDRREGSPYRSSPESRVSSDRDSVKGKHNKERSYSRDSAARTERREARLAKQREKSRSERLSDTRLNNRRVKPRGHLNRSKSDSSEHVNKLAMFKELCMDSKLYQYTEKAAKQSHNEAERNNGSVRRRSINSVKHRNWHKELAEQYSAGQQLPVAPPVQREQYSYAKSVPQPEKTADGEKPKRRWAPPVHPSKDLIIHNKAGSTVSHSAPPAKDSYRHGNIKPVAPHKEVSVDTVDKEPSVQDRVAPPSQYPPVQSQYVPPPATYNEPQQDMDTEVASGEESLGISWSVARMRNLFDEKKAQPPPYRSPPPIQKGPNYKVFHEHTNPKAEESYV